MKNSSTIIIMLLVILLLVVVGGSAYYFGTQKSQMSAEQSMVSTSSGQGAIPTITLIPTKVPTALPTETAKPGWQVYRNSQYGFEIWHPISYQALTDAENLYGWPDAVVLFYNGGQSYDLPVEVWDSEAEYKAKYPGTMTNLTVKKVGDKYVTLLNANFESEVDEMIETFKETN